MNTTATVLDRSSEARVPAIAQGLCVPFAPQVSTLCKSGRCVSNQLAFQICFSAWTPGAGPVYGNVSESSGTISKELGTFESGWGLAAGMFRLTALAGADLSSCSDRGFPLLTVNETCSAGQATASMIVVQVRGADMHTGPG